MTDQAPWNRFIQRNEVHIVGEFKNRYGERFIIYRMKNGDTPYFTGDEVDWEPRVNLLWNNANFTFSEDEREQVARILWPTLVEQLKDAQKEVPTSE
jgi:hypothetical protein